MKRSLLLLVAVAVTLSATGLALQHRSASSLAEQWVAKGSRQKPTTAVLIEMGIKDAKPRHWSGRATVKGATLTGREGYRFRKGDKLLDGGRWEASSRRAIRAPKGNPVINKMEPIATVGIVLHLTDIADDAALDIQAGKDSGSVHVPLKDILTGKVHALWDGHGVVRMLSTATPVALEVTEDDFPAAAYAADGTLWVAYISYTVRDESRRIEKLQLSEQPANFRNFYTPEFGDQLFVKYYRDGKWSRPIAVTPAKQDLARCALAAGPDLVYVSYSAQRDGNFDIYQRAIKTEDGSLGPEERLTVGSGPDITPCMCTDQSGNVWLACQSWGEDGPAGILVAQRRQGKTHKTTLGVKQGENCWYPAIAADSTGKVAVAYDVYRDGSYDVDVTVFDRDINKKRTFTIAGTAKAEMRPAVAYQGERLWIAYEEGPENWGYDSGALVRGKGEPLYSRRSVRVVCLEPDGTLKRPVADLPTSNVKNPHAQFETGMIQKFESATRYAYPKVGVDLKGRLWLSYRQSSSSRYSSHPGSYWLSYVRRLDGKSWSEPIEIHHSDGLLDYRPVLLPQPGSGLVIVHNTDGRYSTPEVIDNQIYASVIDLPGQSPAPELMGHNPEHAGPASAAARERAAVKRVRNYRVRAGDKEYQIRRGEYHRHTEISWDGGADGSLEDMFRYGIDVAGMDWIGNGDHDNGAGREYAWWLIQKFSDAYHVPEHFTPMFTYERSVPYPHGHRNVMFTKRGIRTLPRLAPPEGEKKPPGGVHADDTKMLYRYLREFDGICAVHTSATGMGTDWRDNDPVVEPLVEIYQGDRMSYEMEGAPRAGFDPKLGKAPANIAGWYPKGYVNLALQKGYRLGFESSSDHWSTHISYFMILTERHDRKGLLDAIKRRHTYGATDNIIVDVRSGTHIQGDEFGSREAPTLQIHVVGTGDLGKIDVLRDSEVAETLRPQGQAYASAWTDPRPLAGTHYYYIRVVQRDGELAWSSPLWIRYMK